MVRAKLAAAPSLIVQGAGLYKEVPALLQSTLPPILIPPDYISVFYRKAAGGINLGEIFPAGRCECGGKDIVAMIGGIFGGSHKTELKTCKAARTTFRSCQSSPCL